MVTGVYERLYWDIGETYLPIIYQVFIVAYFIMIIIIFINVIIFIIIIIIIIIELLLVVTLRWYFLTFSCYMLSVLRGLYDIFFPREINNCRVYFKK